MSLFAEQYRPGRTRPVRSAGARRQPVPLHRLSSDSRRGAGTRAAAAGRLARAGWRSRRRRSTRSSVDGFSRPRTVEECVRLLADHPGGRRDRRRHRPRRRGQPARAALAAPRQPRRHRRAARVHRHAASASGSARRCRSPTSAGAWHDAPGAVAEWLTLFASPPIRNRATLGGNLATASPIGDAAPLLLALDAIGAVAGRDGRRAVAAGGVLHRLPPDARCSPGEMLTRIDDPEAAAAASLRFYKVAKRRLDDISTVAAAMALDLGRGRAACGARASPSAASPPRRCAWPRPRRP